MRLNNEAEIYKIRAAEYFHLAMDARAGRRMLEIQEVIRLPNSRLENYIVAAGNLHWFMLCRGLNQAEAVAGTNKTNLYLQ